MLQQVRCSSDFKVVIFLQKFQQQKKSRNPQNVVLSVIRKIFAKKVDINVETVNKSQDFAQHPVLLYHTAIDYSQK